MSAVTMQEVLATHRLDVTMWLGVGQEFLCICGARTDDHDAHQVGELVGAGYGDVLSAEARALEDAAEDTADDDLGYPTVELWLRARAAAVRGEG